eukprot:TRINITY_DN1558_c0_g2_i5.p1 TRINITY_DN1558_c0_g2~~TRINITY_DN1558_c0_g2_i5.p1  ORF type:complete len:1215 (+),score=272.89 TRINITY_DN1558_c0_g2_i5:296-3940(+)
MRRALQQAAPDFSKLTGSPSSPRTPKSPSNEVGSAEPALAGVPSSAPRQSFFGAPASPRLLGYEPREQVDVKSAFGNSVAAFELPLRRASWLAVGGGPDDDVPLVRVSHDDLQEAMLRGDLGLVRRLVAEGASVNAPVRPESEDNFMTLLHVLAQKAEVPNCTALIKEVLEMRANLDARSTIGMTPLSCGCLAKHASAVAVLLESRADASVVDDTGRNCVNCAIELVGESKQESCVEVLSHFKRHGVDLNKGGTTTPILEAVKRHHQTIVGALISQGAAPAGLHDAVANAPFSLIKTLVDAEANPFEKDENGKTVMDIALARSDPHILTLLRDYIGDLQRKGHPHLKTRDELEANDRQSVTLRERPGHMVKKASMSVGSTSRRRGCIPERWRGRLEALHIFCKRLNKHRAFQSVMMFVLVLALLLPELWVVFAIANNDVLDVFLVMIFVAFVFEFFVQLAGLWKNYYCTFFFIMDILGALSVTLDHSKVAALMPESFSDSSTLVRSARMVKVSTRTGRILKFINALIVLLPFKKFTKPEAGAAKRIAGKLQTSLSTRVACLIIFTVLVIPVFDDVRYPQDDNSMRSWLDVLQSSYIEGSPPIEGLLQDMNAFYKEKSYFPFQVQLLDAAGSLRSFNLPTKAPARADSIMKVMDTADVGAYLLVNLETLDRFEAMMSCFLILTIILVLVGASLVMHSAVGSIVSAPLEQLLENIKRIAATIFKSVATMANQADTADKDNGDDDEEDSDEAANHTAALLEKVLKKLATLSEIQANSTAMPGADLEVLGDGDRAMLHSLTCTTFGSKDGRLTVHDGDSVDSREDEELMKAIEERLEEVGLTMENFETFDLDIAPMEDKTLLRLSSCLLTKYRNFGFDDACGNGCTWGQICDDFLHAIAAQHKAENPYHNFKHAVDVCFTMDQMLEMIAGDLIFSSSDRYGLMLAAIGHDVAHPGVNNAFLVETADVLALRYNDASPLENMHCATLFRLARDEEHDMFAEMSKQHYQDVRVVIIDAILHTDYANHFSMLKEMQQLYDVNRELFDVSACMYRNNSDDYPSREIVELLRHGEPRKNLRQVLLHLVDTSNPMKPWEQAEKWAVLSSEECFLQGDQERQLGMPVQPLNDRANANNCYSQICFIEYFVAPLAMTMEKILPPLDLCLDAVLSNMENWVQQWSELRGDGEGAEEEKEKMWERVTKVDAKRMGSDSNRVVMKSSQP